MGEPLTFPAHRIVRTPPADDRVAVIHRGRAIVFDSPADLQHAAARALAPTDAAETQDAETPPPCPTLSAIARQALGAALADDFIRAAAILAIGIPAIQALFGG